MKTDTAIKVGIVNLAICVLGTLAVLACVHLDQVFMLHQQLAKSEHRIQELEDQLHQLQGSYLGHVSQQTEFQRQMTDAAGKAGYWWAYVKLSRAGRYNAAYHASQELGDLREAGQ